MDEQLLLPRELCSVQYVKYSRSYGFSSTVSSTVAIATLLYMSGKLCMHMFFADMYICCSMRDMRLFIIRMYDKALN